MNIAKIFGCNRRRLQACLTAISQALDGSRLRYIANVVHVRVEPFNIGDRAIRSATR